MDSFLPKPIDSQNLLSLLKKHLSHLNNGVSVTLNPLHKSESSNRQLLFNPDGMLELLGVIDV